MVLELPNPHQHRDGHPGRLYPEGQTPADWDKVTNKRFITVLAVGIVVVTMLLAALLGTPPFLR